MDHRKGAGATTEVREALGVNRGAGHSAALLPTLV
jgi:hypothetical protein